MPLLMAVLLACAAMVGWDRLRQRTPAVSSAVTRTVPPAPEDKSVKGPVDGPVIAELLPRDEYQRAGNDAFQPSNSGSSAPLTAKVAPVTTTVSAPSQVAPPVPFTVVGKKFESGSWEVYLTRGDQVYIATKGTVLAEQYRVVSITPTQINMIYLPLNESQTLQTGAAFND